MPGGAPKEFWCIGGVRVERMQPPAPYMKIGARPVPKLLQRPRPPLTARSECELSRAKPMRQPQLKRAMAFYEEKAEAILTKQ
jgi:hypothetical protein